jgi:hypothetical protein
MLSSVPSRTGWDPLSPDLLVEGKALRAAVSSLLRCIGGIKPPSQPGLRSFIAYRQETEVRCPLQASRGGRPCSSKKQLAPKVNHGAYCWLRLYDGIGRRPGAGTPRTTR